MAKLLNSPIALGRALRDARRDRDLTQTDVAHLAGIAQPTISNIERGSATPSFDTLLRLLAALHLELHLTERGAGSAFEAPPWDTEPAVDRPNSSLRKRG